MKKKVANIVPEKIKMDIINIFKAQMDTSDAFLEKPKKAEFFDFGISNEMGHNFNDKRCRCRLYLSLDACDSMEKPIGLSLDYGIEFHFFVENFLDFFRDQKGKGIDMDSNLGATLLAMAYSTARGIVYERTRGTFFDGVLLPVIDPYKILFDNKLKKN